MVKGPSIKLHLHFILQNNFVYYPAVFHFSFEICFSLLSFNHSGYFQDKMTKVKDIDSSSVDSKSLGETTDVLNMVMAFLFMYLDISLNFLRYLYLCMYFLYCSVICIECFCFGFLLLFLNQVYWGIGYMQ